MPLFLFFFFNIISKDDFFFVNDFDVTLCIVVILMTDSLRDLF